MTKINIFCKKCGKKRIVQKAEINAGRRKTNLCHSCYSHKKKGSYGSIHNGYFMIYRPNHPFAKKNGYIFEHRLVMEKYIGRYLQPTEQIHHINRNKLDNNIENLELTKNGEHCSKYHKKNRKCIICDKKHCARGYCEPHYWQHWLKSHRAKQ